MALTAVAVPTNVSADEVDTKIQQKDQTISGLKSKEADNQKQIDALQEEVAAINEKAQTLITEQGKLRAKADKLADEISQLNKRIEKREKAIQDQARDVQVNGNSTSYIDAVVNAKSFSDAITRVQAMSTIIGANNDLVEQQKEDKKTVETKKAENEEKIQKIEENQVALEAQKGELVQAEANLKVAQTSLAAERATAEDEKANLVKEKEAAEAAAAEVAAQEKAAQERAAQAAAEAQQAATNNSQTQTTPSNTEPTPSIGGGGGNVIPTPVPDNPGQKDPGSTPPPPPTIDNGSAVSIAMAQIGKPYVWGAKGPNSFDCSGLVYYAYLHATGRNVGGYTVAQEGAGTRISVDQAQAGDLYFWGSPGGTYHVAIATGGGGYVHAATPELGVTTGAVGGSFTPSFAVRM